MSILNNFPYKAVLWDLDGTLADTLQDLAESANKSLKLNGLKTHGLDDYRQMVGSGVKNLIKSATGENTDQELIKKVVADYMRIYNENCLKYVQPYPTVVSTITTLKEAGIKQCVVTNKPEPQMNIIINELFGKDFFIKAVGQSSRIPVKPDPTGTYEALEACDVTASQALFVGDSDVDVITAKNAGMFCAGACWGFRGKQELKKTGADYLLDNAQDVLKII